MEGELPPHVRDYRLETQFLGKGVVEHSFDDPEAPPGSPLRVEKWESEKLLRRGGQGQVFRERCITEGRANVYRAVKKMAFYGDDRTRRYIRELETIVRFSHQKYSSYFVKSLGWYRSSTSLYIAMEYLPEGDLGAYLRQQPAPLPENEARQIISQVLHGLAIMHREKYAHRDIKPENILIHQRPIPGGPHNWWVKLADFGLTKILARTAISASTAMGTPEYMAPELLLNHWQTAQDGDLPDLNYFATDVWSLGATVFHMLTGTLPFKGYPDMFQYVANPDILFSHANLDQHLVSLDGHDFVRALLEPKPEQRPDSDTARSHAWLLSYAPKMVAHGDFSCPHSEQVSSVTSIGMEARQGLATPVSKITGLFDAPGTTDHTSIPNPGATVVTVIRPKSAATVQTHQQSPVVAASPRENDMLYDCPADHKHKRTFKSLEELFAHCEKRHIPESAIAKSLRQQERILLWTARMGYEAATNLLLLENDLDLESRDTLSRTSLAMAAIGGHEKIVGLLLEKGADLESRDFRSMTPLALAVYKEHEEVVRFLIGKGAKLESRDHQRRTPLAMAAEKGHEEISRVLLEKGANPEKRGADSATPLALAATGGHEKVVRLLLEKDADLENKDKFSMTPLARAAREGHAEVVRLLLEKGADLESQDSGLMTPLGRASVGGHEQVVRLLVEKGADLESQDFGLMTPLCRASVGGHEEVVRLLVKKGANLESRDKWLMTPLALAVYEDKTGMSMIKFLLEKGADPMVRDVDGETPLDYARAKGTAEGAKVADLLEEWIARRHRGG